MDDEKNIPDPKAFESYSSRAQYKQSITLFDAAICEGCAVSQALSGQNVHSSLGYATHVFVRILAHGRNLIGSMPKSRWSSSGHVDWDFGANAGNFRTIIESALLFYYLSDADPDPDNQRAIVQVMHLYDLTKRAKVIHGGNMDEESEKVRAEIIARIESTQRYRELPINLQKKILKGERLMIESKEDVMARLGWDSETFYFFWNHTSQYAHVYSLAFYRIEPNGRGTGIENSFDRGALALGMETCASVLRDITDTLCEHFPNAKGVRNGVHSKFSPSPARNLPREYKRLASAKRKPSRR